MPHTPQPDPRGQRPRVLMLVDNAVDGDSRVQKVAMSAAEAGWDVTLVGRSPTGEPDERDLGRARVRRIDVPFTLLSYSHRTPGKRWRFLFAYRSREFQYAHQRALDARASDLRARRTFDRERMQEIRVSGSWLVATPRVWFVKMALIVRQYRYRADRLWHRARSLQYRRAVTFARAPRGVLDMTGARLHAALSGHRVWRSFDPLLWDVELAYGPVADALKPDLIHAHDFRMAGVAARAAARAREHGRTVPVVYDIHEDVRGIRAKSLRWKIANAAHEQEYIARADAVVTVSDRLAEILQARYRLAERPTVVLNAPEVADTDTYDTLPSIRSECGLADDVPLVVYSGGAAEQRGLRTMVEALPVLPGVHTAFVVSTPPNPFVAEMVELADSLGVGDRLHVVGYVPQQHVAAFLSSATVGAIPILHYPNHEIALITKYFEYMHAHLPIVVSDVETMAAETRSLGNGVVFAAGDVHAYAASIREVLAHRDRYTSVYEASPEILDAYSWSRQAERLLDLYTGVSGRTPMSWADEPVRPAQAVATGVDGDRS